MQIMVKLITTALALASLVPAPGHKEIVKLPLAGDGSVIVKVMPHRAITADGDYLIEGQTKDATGRYEELKRALDERYSRMFDLREEINRTRGEVKDKLEEYRALRESYHRELKRIIATWVTESDYFSDNAR